ncbi:unnamed protein product [Gongylonema pulchrum]|uniref:Macoilin n=1 Tax=Gongylonema pulchrum TaxID=637853 RepID=A0A183EBE6_9BILA|nr:unnamed protein product [Gongylonema pulchrum]
MFLWRKLWDLVWGALLYIFGAGDGLLDEHTSFSSNAMESDDDMEQEETLSQPGDNSLSSNRSGSTHRSTTSSKKNKVLAPSSAATCSRAKGGRSRGRNVQNHANYVLSPLTNGATALSSSTLGATCALNNNLLNLATGGVQQDRQIYSSVPGVAYPSLTNSSGDAAEKDSASGVCATQEKPKDDTKSLSVMVLNYFSPKELETLRNDLRAARCQEVELRYLIQQYENGEKQMKGELAQMKLKQEQSDSKLANVLKARDQDRSAMQLLEKRLIEAQTKRNELEKELNAEKRSKIKEEHAAARALAAAQSNKYASFLYVIVEEVCCMHPRDEVRAHDYSEVFRTPLGLAEQYALVFVQEALIWVLLKLCTVR